MNQQLSTRWADLAAMLLSIVIAIGYTILTSKGARGTLRPLAFFFLIFGPLAVGIHMVAHQCFVNYIAVQKMLAGNFGYDFRFYALNLMGITLAVLGFNMLRSCMQYFKGDPSARRRWFSACGWVVLVAAPTIPFTFIGSLPVQAVALNLIASFFVRNRKKTVPVLKMHPLQKNTLRKAVPAHVAP